MLHSLSSGSNDSFETIGLSNNTARTGTSLINEIIDESNVNNIPVYIPNQMKIFDGLCLFAALAIFIFICYVLTKEKYV